MAVQVALVGETCLDLVRPQAARELLTRSLHPQTGLKGVRRHSEELRELVDQMAGAQAGKAGQLGERDMVGAVCHQEVACPVDPVVRRRGQVAALRAFGNQGPKRLGKESLLLQRIGVADRGVAEMRQECDQRR